MTSSATQEPTGLLKLPPELLLLIWEHLPNFWTTISLRLACRALNDFYKEPEHEKKIVRQQRERLTEPLHRWYRRMTELHTDPEVLEFPPAQGWDIQQHGNKFVMEVQKHLAYFKRDPTSRRGSIVAPQCYVIDWRTAQPGTPHMLGQTKATEALYASDLPTDRVKRYCIVLTQPKYFVLDTMHGTVQCLQSDRSNSSNEHEFVWDVSAFADWQCRHAEDLNFVYLAGTSSPIELDGIQKQASPSEWSELQRLLTRYNWPAKLDRDGSSELEHWVLAFRRSRVRRYATMAAFVQQDRHLRYLQCCAAVAHSNSKLPLEAVRQAALLRLNEMIEDETPPNSVRVYVCRRGRSQDDGHR